MADPLDIVNLSLHIRCGDGLHQIAGCVELKGRDGVLLIAGAKNNLAVRAGGKNPFRQGKTAHASHIDVQKGNVRRIIFYKFQSFLTVGKPIDLPDIGGCLDG